MNVPSIALEGLFLGQEQTAPRQREKNGLVNLLFGKNYQSKSNLEQMQVQSNLQFLEQKLSTSPQHVQDAIEIDRRIKHGNPVFKGTRVPVYIIIQEIADGTTLDNLIEGYPTLNLEQIKAGLDFAASLSRIYND